MTPSKKTTPKKPAAKAPAKPKPAPVPDPELAKLEQAFAATKGNFDSVRKSRRCGCYFCRGLFTMPRVHQWLTRKGEMVELKELEGRPARRPDEQPFTATCPECGADAVLGDAAGFPLTEADLARLGEYALTRIQGNYKPIVARDDAGDDEELLREMDSDPGVESLWGPRFHDETDGVAQEDEE